MIIVFELASFDVIFAWRNAQLSNSLAFICYFSLVRVLSSSQRWTIFLPIPLFWRQKRLFGIIKRSEKMRSF